MHPQQSEAIILQHLDYGESDRIVTFFTPGHGLLKGFARGARKSRKRFGAALEPFTNVGLIWQRRPNSSLLALQEAELISLRDGLRRELKALALASYACELVAVMFGEGEGHDDVYRLLNSLLDQLEQDGGCAEYRLLLELRLLRLSGHEPHLLHCSNCGGGLPSEVYFNVEHGGSLCPACQVPGSMRVALTTLGSLARCRETRPDLFAGFRLGSTTLEEGTPLCTAALDRQLPHPLKSRAFLDSLGPLPAVPRPHGEGRDS